MRVVEHAGDPLDLLSVWSGYDLAILVDALNAPDEAGAVRRFDPAVDLPPDRESIVSSHGHSLWDAWELSGLLGHRPNRTLVFTVSGARFDQGEGCSPEVEVAVDEIVQCLLNLLS